MASAEKTVKRRKKAKEPLHIIFAASECLPFQKTGGLADVTASLPKELAALGHTVEIFIPLYLKALLYPIDHGTPIRHNTEFSQVRVRLEDYSFRSRIYSTEMPDAPVRVHLVDSETYEYFTSRSAHASPYSFNDNFGRFAFFSKVVAGISAKRADRPHIIHAHDWPTGLVPTFMSTEFADAEIATVFTIHNMGYTHAVPPAEFFRMTRVTEQQYPGLADWKERGILHHDKIDMLKAGIVRADMVNTVSPTYAEEIQSATYGGTYAATLKWLAKQGQLKGILNGVDPMWRPSMPVENFLQHKKEQKRQIQEIFGLPPDESAFLVVMTSRLAYQKGYQLLPETLAELKRRRVKMQLVAAVDGEPHLKDMFVALDSRDFPVRHRPYNESLTRQVIYPGADALLMPSVYEPCGLSQIIAQQNGALPIVHATGGLRDTVKDGETGFCFFRYGPGEFAQVIERAQKLYSSDPPAWDAMRRRVMDLDYSWRRSAEAYVELYREAIARARERLGKPPAERPAPPVAPAARRQSRTPRTKSAERTVEQDPEASPELRESEAPPAAVVLKPT
ncbi:MAG: glycogen/starch synthase [Myxococcota bacterium]